jgi:hypothetical protein
MARKLIDPETGDEIMAPNEAPDLVGAAASGDRVRALRSLRDVVARTIAGTDSARDVAALSRQLTDVLAQIEAAEKAEPEKKGSPLDELQNRRAARKPAASRRTGS